MRSSSKETPNWEYPVFELNDLFCHHRNFIYQQDRYLEKKRQRLGSSKEHAFSMFQPIFDKDFQLREFVLVAFSSCFELDRVFTRHASYQVHIYGFWKQWREFPLKTTGKEKLSTKLENLEILTATSVSFSQK